MVAYLSKKNANFILENFQNLSLTKMMCVKKSFFSKTSFFLYKRLINQSLNKKLKILSVNDDHLKNPIKITPTLQ